MHDERPPSDPPDETRKSPRSLDQALGVAARGALNVMRALSPSELATLPGRGLDKLRAVHAAKAARRRGQAPDWTLRGAVAEDLPRLARLQALAQGTQASSDPVDERARQRRWQAIEAAGGQVWLLESAGELAGAATFFLLPSLAHDGQPLALLQDLIVDPSARARGVARLMITELSLHAQALGARRLALSVERGGAAVRQGREGRDYIEQLTAVKAPAAGG
ncbi:N-acetyltransferase family protein [Leptothrix sp. BB-4]